MVSISFGIYFIIEEHDNHKIILSNNLYFFQNNREQLKIIMSLTYNRLIYLHFIKGGCFFSLHEFEQALGAGDEQGSLACCSSWCCKQSDTTEWLNYVKSISLKTLVNYCIETIESVMMYYLKFYHNNRENLVEEGV